MNQISVIIPTYSRKNDLIETLNCLTNQSFKNFEVIVIDASDMHNQLSVSDVEKYKFNINYIRYGIPGNVSKQRNIGLSKSLGKYILFLDDDVLFNSELLCKYFELFQDYEAISGLVLTEKKHSAAKPIPRSSSILLDVGYVNYQNCNFIIKTPIICSANFGMHKTVYDKFGGFDEYIFGNLDDADYGLKLWKNGVKIIHHPDVSVFHKMSPMSGSRSTILPEWWKYYNLSYFQRKNRKQSKIKLFVVAGWQLMRPSRVWLTPRNLITRYISFINGLNRAFKINLPET